MTKTPKDVSGAGSNADPHPAKPIDDAHVSDRSDRSARRTEDPTAVRDHLHAPKPAPEGSIAGEAEKRGPARTEHASRGSTDALALKHRSESFDNDFRTVDYGKVAGGVDGQDNRERSDAHAAPRRSDPHAATDAGETAHFAGFGSGSVSAGFVRSAGGSTAPSMTPHLPGEDSRRPQGGEGFYGNPAGPAKPRGGSLAGPHADRPFGDRHARAQADPDPLVDKYKAEPFQRNFRSVDYSNLGSVKETDRTRSIARLEAMETQRRHSAATRRGAGRSYVPQFQMLGVAGALQGVGLDEDVDPIADDQTEQRVSGFTEVREPERLERPRGDRPDDLTRIDAIGPTIERLLFEHGIYHFEQIAAWRSGETKWIEEMLGFRGRIEREDWIGQAKALADRQRAN